MQNRSEESSSFTKSGKKKKTKKDLSMMELVEQVNSHKSKGLDPAGDHGRRQLPKQRSYPQSSSEEYYTKHSSGDSDDSDGVQSEPARVERPPRPSTARGRRRVTDEISAPSSTGSEQGRTDSPMFEEELMTPNRSSKSTSDTDPPRSRSRMTNHRPLKYKQKASSKEVNTSLQAGQGQTGRSRNLPPLSRELSSIDNSFRQIPSNARLGRETSVLSSIQPKTSHQGPQRSNQGQSSDIYTLERQRTIILEKS